MIPSFSFIFFVVVDVGATEPVERQRRSLSPTARFPSGSGVPQLLDGRRSSRIHNGPVC